MKAKQPFNALMMGGTVSAWRTLWEVPDSIRTRDLKIALPTGGVFDLQTYLRALEKSPEWLTRAWPRMAGYASTWRTHWNPNGGDAQNSLLSFAMQTRQAQSC